jgi:hypothetical protein
MTNQRFRSGCESSGILSGLELALLVCSADSCLGNGVGRVDVDRGV